MKRRAILLLVLLTSNLALAADSVAPDTPAAVTAATPPIARTVDAVDQAFGLRVPDPYRWMEGDSNPEFAAWLNAQGEHGRAQLDALARLPFWRDRLGAAARGGTVNRLQQPMAGRIFFLRFEQGGEGVLMVRDRDGRERTLLRPGERGGDTAAAAITIFSPSLDGRRIAVNVQHGAGEITRIEVLDVATGKAAPDVIDDVWGQFAANWLPDGSGFTYTQLAPPASRDPTDMLLNMRVRLHKLGNSPADDPVLLARGSNPRVQLAPNDFPFIDVSETSDKALLIIGGARPEFRICVTTRERALRPDAPWRCLIGFEDRVQQYALNGNRLYYASMAGAPNGRLYMLDLARSTDLKRAAAVLPEADNKVITALAAAKDGLYVKRMMGGPDQILRVAYDKAAKAVPIALPYLGSVYLFAADPNAPGLVFTLQGWTQPRAAFRLSAIGARLEDLKLGADASGDYSDIVAVETEAKSADGTMVPLSVIRSKNAQPVGDALVLLDGYGAYGYSDQPHFDPLMLEWVKAGHVYAVAHVRGGGEKGVAWRLAGSREFKERGVEDFIACGEALVASGWTRPGRIIAFGGSMGGVLVGGAITRTPELFGAAAVQSGELNVSRLQAAKNGANQYAEVGDPNTDEGLHSLAAMDPYQRIKYGTRYPPLLLIVGLSDNRVAPWSSGKFGARLMAANTALAPVWFRTDQDMGHFNTAAGKLAGEYADVFSFAEAQMH